MKNLKVLKIIIKTLASGENPLDATQKASSERSMALECMENARLTKEKERLVGICCGENPRSRESKTLKSHFLWVVFKNNLFKI